VGAASPLRRAPTRTPAWSEPSDQDVDASFAQMSKRFHEEGGEIYVPAE
jgi:hypothetical protein